MCGRKFLRQWLWHSLMKLCTKNCENLSIYICNSYGEKIDGTFFMWKRCIQKYKWARAVRRLDCSTGIKKDKCYFTRRSRRWFKARNKCLADDADLAVLTQDVYWWMRQNTSHLTPRTEYYIGLANVRLLWNATGIVELCCHFFLKSRIQKFTLEEAFTSACIYFYLKCS